MEGVNFWVGQLKKSSSEKFHVRNLFLKNRISTGKNDWGSHISQMEKLIENVTIGTKPLLLSPKFYLILTVLLTDQLSVLG